VKNFFSLRVERADTQVRPYVFHVFFAFVVEKNSFFRALYVLLWLKIFFSVPLCETWNASRNRIPETSGLKMALMAPKMAPMTPKRTPMSLKMAPMAPKVAPMAPKMAPKL
jgi:hypothetical protein